MNANDGKSPGRYHHRYGIDYRTSQASKGLCTEFGCNSEMAEGRRRCPSCLEYRSRQARRLRNPAAVRMSRGRRPQIFG